MFTCNQPTLKGGRCKRKVAIKGGQCGMSHVTGEVRTVYVPGTVSVPPGDPFADSLPIDDGRSAFARVGLDTSPPDVGPRGAMFSFFGRHGYMVGVASVTTGGWMITVNGETPEEGMSIEAAVAAAQEAEEASFAEFQKQGNRFG